MDPVWMGSYTAVEDVQTSKDTPARWAEAFNAS